eukprot:313556_1
MSRFGNWKQKYDIFVVSGTGDSKIDGIFSYSSGVLHGYKYRINKQMTEISQLVWDMDDDDEYGYGYMKPITLFKRNSENDKNWSIYKHEESTAKETNKTINTISVKFIQINETFVENNIKNHIKQHNNVFSKHESEIISTLKELVSHEFIVNELISMLYCNHTTLSIMPMHYETGKCDVGWIVIICELCDYYWHIGTDCPMDRYNKKYHKKSNKKSNKKRYNKAIYKKFDPKNLCFIKRRYDLEHGSLKRTTPLWSLKKKREQYELQKTEN